MRKIIFLFIALMAMRQSSFAQSDSVEFDITITNPAAITHYSITGVPVFSSSSINTILAGYNISEFNQSYATANSYYLRHIYHVRCNSINLATALHAADSILFPEWQKTPKAQVCTKYTPNDWNKAISGGSDYIDYINGRDAWSVTRGDTSVVIGVTDPYRIDYTHPDFYNSDGTSKIKYIAHNDPPYLPPFDSFASYHHGTTVSSLIAGATDNNIGLPAIGFNCRLDFVNSTSGGYLLAMSKRVRIINGSWLNGVDSVLNLRKQFYQQELYNDIYENGAFACFAAGNGKVNKINPNHYAYPASLDHVFSTTSIGWKNDKASSNDNVKGMHKLNLADSTSTYNHNNRVDLCAPTFLGAARTNPRDTPSVQYYNSASGTSSSSPLVAGTAGLLQSALKAKLGPYVNFSPYQLEWLIKETALTDFLYYPENLPYTDRLGVGRLNSEAAVKRVANTTFNPNNYETQTLYIKGIEINSICAPGKASNGVLPKLKPIIVNGVPPYTYVWEQVKGQNYATLDNEDIAEPTVIACDTPYVLYYRLTVYDGSYFQKVAMKSFKIQFKTSGHDLAMRDSYADMLDEPNTQAEFTHRDWDFWSSQDIWNRQYADAGTEHQNPEYFTSDPNHLYTRVRNVGCSPNPTNHRLRTYWSKASTGEDWKADWTTSLVPGIGTMQPGGREITPLVDGIPLPVIQPGDANIIHQEWYPINPLLYEGAPTSFDVCFLARIEGPHVFSPETGWRAHGMAIRETLDSGIKANVRNNNNIVTRNTILTNLRPDNLKTAKHQLTLANANAYSNVFNFEFSSERSIFRHFAGDFSSLGSVTLHLGNLYDVWVNSGSHGTVASSNAQARTVTFDGANTLRLDSLHFTANQKFIIEVEFKLDSPVVVDEISNHVFHARQFEVSNPNDVYGAVNYHVTVSPSAENNYRKTLLDSTTTGSVNQSFIVAPNPTSGIVRLSFNGEKDNATEILVTDMVGKKVMTEKITFSPGSKKEINLSRFASGVYLINITNNNGTNEVYKVVKE